MKRRNFLRTLGAASAALPFLDILRAPTVRAQDDRPLRVVFWFLSEGSHPDKIVPQGEGSFRMDAGYELPYVFQPFNDFKQDRLTILAPPASHAGTTNDWYQKPSVGLSYAPHNVEGAEQRYEDEGHHMHQILASSRAFDPHHTSDPFYGTSLDQVLGAHARENFGTPRGSLYFGVWPDAGTSDHKTRMSYIDGTAQDPYKDPNNTFDALFGGLMGGGGDGPNPQAARREEVANFLNGRFANLQSRLGCEDRQRVQAHLEYLHELETGVRTSASCEPPSITGEWGPVTRSSDASGVPSIEANMHRMAAMALACDMTRVVVMQHGYASSTMPQTFLQGTYGHQPHAARFDQPHHGLAHEQDDGAQGAIADIAHYDHAHMANFLRELERFPSQGGTLADDTVIIKVTDISSPTNHAWGGHTVPLLGGAAGRFQSGRVERVDATFNQLWTSVAQWFGVEGMERFGPSWVPGGISL